MTTDEATKKIVAALENPKYKWRTIRGIAVESGLDPAVVESKITENGHIITKSSANNQKGEALFTTRGKYRDEASTLTRLGSVLKNRSS